MGVSPSPSTFVLRSAPDCVPGRSATGEDMSFRFAEKIMGMNATTWARHANPWSGWSRVSILPLLTVAAWSRVWIGWWALLPVAAVLIWTWLNPRLFPPPASTDNWMSRGILGERIWLADGRAPALAHHRPAVRNLAAMGSAGALLLLLGLILLDLPLTVAGLAIAILSKLWLLDRMVWVHRDATGESKIPASQQPASASRDDAPSPR